MLFARRKAFFGEFAPFPAAGNRSPANFTAFPPHETVFREILSLSRRGKPFFGEFFPFPAAGRRFSENLPHFPPREGVFRRIYPISRRGKAFWEISDRFRVSFWRFTGAEIHFVFEDDLSASKTSCSNSGGASNLLAFHAPLHG